MKTIKIFAAAACTAVLSLTSCYDLERNPEGQLSSGSMFQNEEQAKEVMMGVYQMMHNDNVLGFNYCYDGLGGISYLRNATALQPYVTGNVASNWGHSSNKWAALYEGITRANILLQNVDKCDMSEALIAQYKGEARFMRGFYYWQLLNFFGGVPIYDESVVISENVFDLMLPRSTMDEVRSFIIADMDAAAAVLPDEWDTANYGRATKWAAIALKGEAHMYAFNVAGAPDHSAANWSEAEKCFSQLISSGKFALYPDYAALFVPSGMSLNGVAGGDCSNEMIFALQNMSVTGQENGISTTFHCGTRASYGSSWNDVMVSSSFADAYEYADGRPFDWDEIYPGFTTDDAVKHRVFDSEAEVVSNITVVKSYSPERDALRAMYASRDPRMNASLITPYADYLSWYNNAPMPAEYLVLADQSLIKDGSGFIRSDGNFQCYYWRKFVAEGDWNGLITNRAHTPMNYPIIRYADVLLREAECLNELDKQPEAVTYINMVRERVNMPGINSGESYLAANSKEEVAARIRHERMVELANEGHRFFDMKRWGLLESFNGRSEYPLNGGKPYYTNSINAQSYLFPIPLGEIDKNPDLTQNPGY